MEFIVLLVIVVVAWMIISSRNKKKRRQQRIEALQKKYGDAEIVEMIMGRSVWQGQTEEQLIDSRGRPADIEQRVLKTKTKETWKYEQVAKNRFNFRVLLEDGVVVGWERK